MHGGASPATVAHLVGEWAARTPGAVAIAAPGREPLLYERLDLLLRGTARRLSGLGLCGGAERVALVLPDGPEAATAFLAVSAATACAPLNPGLTAPEILAQLRDMAAHAVLLREDAPGATAEAVRASGAMVLALRSEPRGPAGWFEFADPMPPAGQRPSPVPRPGDVALVLHTSGTTSRPKRVGLSHANLTASARHVASALGLHAADRCLDLMPLFHIHGLVAGVLASLAAGGSVACPGGFEAPRFFEWLDALRPSWFTAVPTMHQAILAHAGGHAAELARAPLRFVRSSSSPLPPAVMERLEAVFGVPVVEAYGMTEAAHQIACNPLPPRPRKAGSVGVASGPEIAIMNTAGALLAPGETGEVVVRGPNVITGYENASEVNSATFVNGWFRTGDLGAFDSEGYLFLKGRLKELINRGGEKVAPREVEEVLLDHPAVAQAAAFPVPDPTLGEVVGAAIVLKGGASATGAELRGYAARRLAHFKLPQHVVLVPEIPRGPTGKIQRAQLAERLGLTGAADEDLDRTPPRTQLEARLLRLWSELLRVEVTGVHAHFLRLGGDSLTAMRMLERARADWGVELSLAQLFEAPTVAGMAALLQGGAAAAAVATEPRPDAAR